MSDCLNLLILLLKEINSDNSIHVINNEYAITPPLVDAANYMAYKYLNKHENYIKNRNEIINAGFNVVSNTTNKYGWVSDYIILNRGIITYKIVFIHHV